MNLRLSFLFMEQEKFRQKQIMPTVLEIIVAMNA
jgi:hypothetical protein